MGIITQNNVWEENYVPEKPLYREDIIDTLYHLLNQRGAKVLCLGEYGTGKTCCVRHLLGKIKFPSTYISCASFKQSGKSITLNRILTILLRDTGYREKVYPTLPFEFKLEMLRDFSARYDKYVLVIDEVDYYITPRNNDFESFLYLISRNVPKINCVLITNKLWIRDSMEKLDPRVVDSFVRRMHSLAFRDYTKEELYGILKQRAKIGFREGSYSDDVLDLIARLSYANGLRARGVITMAKKAANIAVREESDIILMEHVDMAFEDIMSQTEEIAEVVKGLDPASLNILYILMENKGKAREVDVRRKFMDLNEELPFGSGRSRRTFFNSVARMKGMEIIGSEIKVEKTGKTPRRYGVLSIYNEAYSLVKVVLEDLLKERGLLP